MNPRPLRARLPEYAAIALLLAGTTWLGSLVRHNVVEHGGSVQPAGRVAAPVEIPAADAAGAPAPIRLSDSDQPVLLLVMSTQCPFCEENMDAWRELVASWRSASPRAEVLALSTGSAEQTLAYLAAHDVDVPFRTVSPAVLPLLGADGYPTTAVFVPADRSLAIWPGVLRAGALDAVLGTVGRSGGVTVAGGM